jgi:hypothetical protein
VPDRLIPHPGAGGPPVRLKARAERQGSGRLQLQFRLEGDLDRLRIPPPTEPARADGLWRATCFEAFLAPVGGEGYVELNLAPDGRWAAYRFDGYRAGMRNAERIAPPTISVGHGADLFTLAATVDLGEEGDLAGAPWRVALTAVIEDVAGALSYWALAHPHGQPDFHHPAGFVLELPPPAA